MTSKGKPLIQFARQPEADKDIVVHCERGHESFKLIVLIRLGGASVTRYAKCVTCGETQPID